jgi:formylglycine-generating enzyme required for sulfatase activity
MQNNLDINNYTLKQIDEIYYATLNKIEKVVNDFFGEVVLWTNKNKEIILLSSVNKLRKWNQYVYENLGIDNLLAFHNYINSYRTDSSVYNSLPSQENDFEMVEVKGGTFKMGCHDDGFDWEFPVHKVKVNSFKISKYLVTQKQWVSVMGYNPSHFKGYDLPVENVTWIEVQEFITKLNEVTGKNYRLPTENEWEYAARGGKKSKKYKYCGSNNIDEVAWYDENSNNTTHPVGMKKPNELGIYDMSGNVYEWCDDVSEVYPGAAIDFPINPEHVFRVIRGGGWKSKLEYCRVYSRNRSPQEFSNTTGGFRLVLP